MFNLERETIPTQREMMREKEVTPERLEAEFIERESKTLKEIEEKRGKKLGKWKKALVGMTIGAIALAGIAGMSLERGTASAKEQPKTETIERKPALSQEQKLAIGTWKDLMEISAKLEERDPTMKAIKSKIAVQQIIEAFTAQLKSGELNPKDVFVSRQDFFEALVFLNGNLLLYIDQESEYGNKDGKCSSQEMDEFIKKEGSNTGLKLFQEHYRSYLQEKYGK